MICVIYIEWGIGARLRETRDSYQACSRLESGNEMRELGADWAWIGLFWGIRICFSKFRGIRWCNCASKYHVKWAGWGWEMTGAVKCSVHGKMLAGEGECWQWGDVRGKGRLGGLRLRGTEEGMGSRPRLHGGRISTRGQRGRSTGAGSARGEGRGMVGWSEGVGYEPPGKVVYRR